MPTRPANPRLSSLDAFRGFTIASMMLVNNPGDWSHLYPQLEHAAWNGWTFTDWVFPFFLFISGISMSLSLARLLAQGADKPRLLRKLCVRALWVFLIGFALNLFPYFNFATVRIPGVLQRIAVCTMLAAPIAVYGNWRQQCCWIVGLFAVYSVLMLGVAVPDAQGRVAAGVLEPGRDVGAFVDRWLLSGHLWVQSKTWDPEGLLSTLPAVASLLFGMLTGHWLRAGAANKAAQTVWMLLAGLACLWGGTVLDNLLMPINKSLWTPSYCVFMTGWALLVFSAFYWLLDAVDSDSVRAGAARLLKPFVIYGMNALFLFALSGVIAKLMGYIKFAQPDGKLLSLKGALYAPLQALPLAPVNASLLFALAFNAVMFSIAWLMWRKHWFLKV
jgi:predicted acyltransferase